MSTPPSAPRSVIPRPGDVLKIQEADYRYGQGELILRVTEVGRSQQLTDGEWLTISGIQIGWNGAEFGERAVDVRLSSLMPRRGRP
jgi:hypothetical protein